ncbi:MAG: VTT domain-containing protein [Anaerolineae bacterium]|nr:VTT domain-containing protein [Anaerolineae bacterium]
MSELLGIDEQTFKEFIAAIGYIGIFGIIFAESGLLIGFFLPGDSLLFTAGAIAGSTELQNTLGVEFQIEILATGCFIAAVTGDSVGYWFGNRVGRRLFQREDSRLFKKKYLYQSEALYEKHGGIIIVIARFMPFVRTFAPIVAGMGSMNYRRFISYNVFGGLLWAVGVTIAGYLLGEAAEGYLTPLILIIIIVSVLPPGIHVLRDYLKERKAKRMAAETESSPGVG